MSFDLHQNSETSISQWWLQVGAKNPICLYYFGPFHDEQEVRNTEQEYLKNLRKKSSVVVFSRPVKCQPRKLTLYEKELTIQDLESTPVHFFEALVLR